jgi:3-hydroxyacyl-[acyl-carrier-protein] dehydratase
MSGAGFQQMLRVDENHPALPGHFPAQPLVPAVMLLEQVALALRTWRGQRLAQVLEAKFVAPLRPDEIAMLQLSEMAEGTRVRFRIERDGILLARGVVEGTA